VYIKGDAAVSFAGDNKLTTKWRCWVAMELRCACFLLQVELWLLCPVYLYCNVSVGSPFQLQDGIALQFVAHRPAGHQQQQLEQQWRAAG
jgi:hypothetical protein